MSYAYALANEIELITARRLMIAARGRGQPRLTVEEFYDPHAAHLLGELIERRMGSSKQDSGTGAK